MPKQPPMVTVTLSQNDLARIQVCLYQRIELLQTLVAQQKSRAKLFELRRDLLATEANLRAISGL